MELIPSIFLFAAIAALTPGPNNIMLMASGLNFGIRASMPHLLGICVGFPVMVILIGLGLGFIFARYPACHLAVKIIGLAYLFYLAWRMAQASAGEDEGKRGRALTFWQAALFQWVNAKGWIMASSAIAAYTSAGDEMYSQILIISLIFFSVTLPAVTLWLLFGAALQKWLKSRRQRRIFNLSMAALLILSVTPVIRELFNWPYKVSGS